MAELIECVAQCTTPASAFHLSDNIPERTGVATDDHGWLRRSSSLIQGRANQAPTASDFGWYLGYYFIRDVLADGAFDRVLSFTLLVGTSTSFQVRLYNVSGTYKFRLWNATADTQVGSDSAGITVGQTMLVNLRVDVAGDKLDLFIDGTNKISASQSIGAIIEGFSGGDAGGLGYWSAWCYYASGSDDLNEAHYPEMRLLHPNGDGTRTDYTHDDYTGWDDLAAEGDPDGDTTYLVGPDAVGPSKIETSTLTTHTMTNTVQGAAELLMLRQDQATKTVAHAGRVEITGSEGISVSFGTEDIGETYVVREAVFHSFLTAPWSQANIDALEAGHLRTAGSDALNIRVTTCALVVVALGTTNLAPPDPPVAARRRAMGFVS